MKTRFLPLALLTLVSCEAPIQNVEPEVADIEENELDYQMINERKIEWNDILSKGQDRYVVYFYSEYCGYCRLIKQTVLNYYLLDLDKMFFVDTVEQNAIYKPNNGDLIGSNHINDIYIMGTPFLMEVINNTVTNWYGGVDSIELYINNRKGN